MNRNQCRRTGPITIQFNDENKKSVLVNSFKIDREAHGGYQYRALSTNYEFFQIETHR